jgi:hypothetical protein
VQGCGEIRIKSPQSVEKSGQTSHIVERVGRCAHIVEYKARKLDNYALTYPVVKKGQEGQVE